jgi:hypothetical protein
MRIGSMRGLGLGKLGRLADGTAVVGTAQGPVPVSDAVANAIAAGGQVPGNAGGAMVQGKGIDFKYSTPLISSLANGASTTVTIQYDQNSTFNWLRTTFACDLTGAAETADSLQMPLVTVNITDQGSGMSFMNAPIPLYNIAGANGSLPYVLPTPQLIQPNASFIYAFANYSAATTYTNLRLVFHGYRIFNSGNQGN